MTEIEGHSFPRPFLRHGSLSAGKICKAPEEGDALASDEEGNATGRACSLAQQKPDERDAA